MVFDLPKLRLELTDPANPRIVSARNLSGAVRIFGTEGNEGNEGTNDFVSWPNWRTTIRQ
jgi:hypothetical protein